MNGFKFFRKNKKEPNRDSDSIDTVRRMLNEMYRQQVINTDFILPSESPLINTDFILPSVSPLINTSYIRERIFNIPMDDINETI